MNFEEALQSIRRGLKVKRASWEGYWFLSTNSKLGYELGGVFHKQAEFSSIIIAKCSDGSFAPAQPYQRDLLAGDWEIVD